MPFYALIVGKKPSFCQAVKFLSGNSRRGLFNPLRGVWQGACFMARGYAVIDNDVPDVISASDDLAYACAGFDVFGPYDSRKDAKLTDRMSRDYGDI